MKIPVSSRLIVLVFVATLFALAAVDANATVRRVPADYPTIQQAINAAVNGDQVLVAPGTYIENINFLGKAIKVASAMGPATTIIDGNNTDTVVRFVSGEGPNSILTGFTIQNGNSNFLLGKDGIAGGIMIMGASPVVSGNVIKNNSATFQGGGVYIDGLSPNVSNNVITANGACEGAGLAVNSGTPTIQENDITENNQSFCTGGAGGAGIRIAGNASVRLIHNTISKNVAGASDGGGITIDRSASGGMQIVQNNIIKENTASGTSASAGGGMVVAGPALILQNLIIGNDAAGGAAISASGGGIKLINNTIADNNNALDGGVQVSIFADTRIINNVIIAKSGQTAFLCFLAESGDMNNVRNNDVFSPQGTSWSGSCPNQTGIKGNISADPLFVNPPTSDYHLQATSPSLDAGDNSAPNLPANDLDGKPRIQDGNLDGKAIVDMGAYEFSPPFNLCLQDDSSSNLLQINTITGAYQFTTCTGFAVGGFGTVTQKGGSLTFQQITGSYRVLAKIDGATRKATASIQVLSTGRIYSITDRDITNNTCTCK